MVRLAVTLGDPRGIGPEVSAAAGRQLLAERDDVELTFYGAADGASLPGALVEALWENSEASAGRAAGAAIEDAVAAILAGRHDALVTAPIHKPGFQAAGYDFPGHTEFLGALAGSKGVGMLMAAEVTRLGSALRVLLATTHLPLRDVPVALTAELLEDQVRLLDDELKAGWGIQAPRIALCAFNPHAGDAGLFGDEEARVYAPAIAKLRAAGISASDPLPADTVFRRTLEGEFDAAVAPYHDVGMAAFKTASFGSGVNVTLGLPFPRTSPDHGTAFDLKGTGTADPSSMLEAMRLAVRLAETRASRTL